MRKALVRIGLFVVGFIIGGLTMLKIGTEPFKSLFSENDRFETVKIIVSRSMLQHRFLPDCSPGCLDAVGFIQVAIREKKRKEGEI